MDKQLKIKNNSLFSTQDLQIDRENIWHPYTSMLNALKVYAVSSANGFHIELDNGHQLIDGMSSWWSAIHGYNHPLLNKAATDQLSEMSHVMFGGLTHQPAIELSKTLLDILPSALNKIFYACSGSVAVEVALKMALQYQISKGKKNRKKFMSFLKGYHGDTFGAMSVTDPYSGMHHLFAGFLPEHVFYPETLTDFGSPVDPTDLTKLKEYFENHAETLAGVIVEPVVQGAGGMRFYAAEYLKSLRTLCDEFDVLLIFDEIATGFGRTGKLFALQHAEIVPDILCLGKALTGGYLSFAACISTQNVALTISSGEPGVFMHGPTFMANPLACAIAHSSIKLLLSYDWQAAVERISAICKNVLYPLKENEAVSDVRILGAIAVVETKHAIDVEKAQAYFVQQGVWIRPFRNLIYIMPPYIIEEEALIKLCSAISSYIDLSSS